MSKTISKVTICQQWFSVVTGQYESIEGRVYFNQFNVQLIFLAYSVRAIERDAAQLRKIRLILQNLGAAILCVNVLLLLTQM